MTEEKKKRKPLGLQLTNVTQDAQKEEIRQSLSHGRSKAVTIEVKRKRRPPSAHTQSLSEPHAKLTDQEQYLRRRALQEALSAQESESLENIKQEKEIIAHEDLLDEVPFTLEKKEVQKFIGGIDHGHNVSLEESFSGIADVESSEELAKKAEFQESLRKRRSSYEEKEGEVHEEKKSEGNRKPSKSLKKKGPKNLSYQDTESEESSKNFLGLKKLRKGRSHQARSSLKRGLQKTVTIKENLTVSEFASQLGEKVIVVLKQLSKMGMTMVPENMIDGDTAQLIAEEKGYQVKRQMKEDREVLLWNEEPKHLSPRPPVVTVMGHVDHGKTSLLDALRKTDVAAKEAGGITQHIGAYQVKCSSGQVITFIDTPGHQAFTKMRARGAQTTDIVILVVAADEGINEQTIEAIHHCQAAQVPMIVAINKIDKPGSRPDYVRQQLLTHHIVVENLGGTVQDVEVSALKGTNLDLLEEAILLQAEILGLQADPEMRAKGVILETHVKKGQGTVATLLVQEGQLSKGDVFVVGNTWGKVRLLFNDKGEMIKTALPSQPVEVVGFSEIPSSGDLFIVLPSEAEAKDFVSWKKEKIAAAEESSQLHPALSLLERLKNQGLKEQSVIIKADAQGSLEGIVHELEKIQHEEIAVKIVHKAVGAINEGDVLLAQASNAFIIGFNVPTLPEAHKLIEEKSVKILRHKIIYQVVEDVRQILSGLLAPVFQEEKLGKAEVIQVFHIKKASVIAGCMIKEGIMRRGEYVRIFRGGKSIFEGEIRSLRHVKEDVKEKAAGHECGVMIEGYSDFQIGDRLECFTKKKIERSV